MRADRATAVVASLQEGLVPNEDGVTDLERVRVQDEDPDADLHAVAERLAERAEDDPAGPRAGRGVLVADGAIAREELLLRSGRPQVR